jgi:hypothetical protein
MGGDLHHVLGANKVKPKESTMSEVLTRAEAGVEQDHAVAVAKAAQAAAVAKSNGKTSLDGMKKSAKFRTLGVKRVNSALKRIALIGNLSSRQSYAYTDGDVKKLVGTLRTAIDRMEARFTPSAKESDFSF